MDCSKNNSAKKGGDAGFVNADGLGAKTHDDVHQFNPVEDSSVEWVDDMEVEEEQLGFAPAAAADNEEPKISGGKLQSRGCDGENNNDEEEEEEEEEEDEEADEEEEEEQEEEDEDDEFDDGDDDDDDDDDDNGGDDDEIDEIVDDEYDEADVEYDEADEVDVYHQVPNVIFPSYTPQTPPNSPAQFTNFQLQPIVEVVEYERASDLLMSILMRCGTNQQRITELAVAAMKDLINKASKEEPKTHNKSPAVTTDDFMLKCGSLEDTIEQITRLVEVKQSTFPVLDSSDLMSDHEGECSFMFPGKEPEQAANLNSASPIGLSRETATILMDPRTLVGKLMDVKQWSFVFSNIVSKALVLGVLSTGEAGSPSGAIQVMMAEFHLPSPNVPVREGYFVRYCKQLPCGTWAVVDVSLEDLVPTPGIQYRRKPSGCLIQAMLNECSKVTWIEHADSNNGCDPDMFEPLITSGFAFSARRWLSTLVRESERLSSYVSYSCRGRHEVIITEEGWKNLMKMGERMIRTFCADVNASAANEWLSLPVIGADNVKVNLVNSINDPGRPEGVFLVIATTLWIASPPKTIFDFLRCVNSKDQWDILLKGHTIKEIMRISNDQSPDNYLSVLEISARPNEKNPMLYLQESFTDATGSYVIYAPIDIHAMISILDGADTEAVPILPSGCSILPEKPTTNGDDMEGSLLTVAFELKDYASTPDYIPSQSVETIYRLMRKTFDSIELVLMNMEDDDDDDEYEYE